MSVVESTTYELYSTTLLLHTETPSTQLELSDSGRNNEILKQLVNIDT